MHLTPIKAVRDVAILQADRARCEEGFHQSGHAAFRYQSKRKHWASTYARNALIRGSDNQKWQNDWTLATGPSVFGNATGHIRRGNIGPES
jgi:hypothetical protein